MFELYKVVIACCNYAQESHKHLDEYAEMEAEILRDMEQEQAHKNCRRRPAVSSFPPLMARANFCARA